MTLIPNGALHRLPQQGATVISASTCQATGHRMEFRVVPQNIGGKETVARFSNDVFQYLRGLFKKYPTFGREKYIYAPGGLQP